ncbi:MAG: hypothetical protein SGI77_11935 [Pirellulaceae bacterium]|nr:hypothetical protein [Pirellulaceae bacterium]
MAFSQPIKNGDAKFCRDCGGPLTKAFEDYRICENTTTKGQQQDRKDVCEYLPRERRLFCEFDGQQLELGQTGCHGCKQPASHP